jgi:hypothetical protein
MYTPSVAHDRRQRSTTQPQPQLGLRLTTKEARRLKAIAGMFPFASRHAVGKAIFQVGLAIVEKDPRALMVSIPRGKGTRS